MLPQNTKILLREYLFKASERVEIHYILEYQFLLKCDIHLRYLELKRFWYQDDLRCLSKYPITQMQWINQIQQKHRYLVQIQHITSQLGNSFRFLLQTLFFIQILRFPKTLYPHMLEVPQTSLCCNSRPEL